MVLKVDWADFVGEVASRGSEGRIYLAETSAGCRATFFDPTDRVVVSAQTGVAMQEAEAVLRDAGLPIRRGTWTLDESDDHLRAVTVAAIAYRSEDAKPGLWLDAYHGNRTEGEVIKAMYDELMANQEARTMPLEEFTKLLEPNVLILGPAELQRFADQNGA